MTTWHEPGTFPMRQRAHGYIFNDLAGEVWASCTCGWVETGARHGDRRWREYATACAWDAHCASSERVS